MFEFIRELHKIRVEMCRNFWHAWVGDPGLGSVREAKVLRRLCIKDWSVTAESGDHFEVKVGELYATSAAVNDGKVTVFSNYWVPVPAECFTSDGVHVA